MPKKIEGVLTAVKVDILREIRQLRLEYQAVTTNEISRRVKKAASTVHHHISDLIKWGYVERGNTNGTLVTMWKLTEKGSSLFDGSEVVVEITGSGDKW